MPEWIKNRLTLKCKEARFEEFCNKYIKSGKDYDIFFDFNEIVKMPESLGKVVCAEFTDICVALYILSLHDEVEMKQVYIEALKSSHHNDTRLQWSEEAQNEMMRKMLETEHILENGEVLRTKADIYNYGKTVIQNLLNYGHFDWFTWCNQNWGVKWNAQDTEVKLSRGRNQVEFFTPDVSVFSLMFKLGEANPDIDIVYEFASEDIGSSAGMAKIKGVSVNELLLFKDKEKAAYEKYFDLWGKDERFRYDSTVGTYVLRKKYRSKKK